MAEQLFAWSKKDISLRRLVEGFQHKFPVVVKTTCGYAGTESELHEVGHGEVYWIFAVHRQQRVVAKDYCSRYISIPVESDFQFQQQRRDTQALSRPMTLGDVIRTGCCGQRIVFERNQRVTFLLGNDFRSTTQFGVIEVMDSYDEKYLLGRIISASGQLCEDVVAIPVYLPIRLSFAQSLKDGDTEYFRNWKQVLVEEGSTSSDQVALCKEILIFEELPTEAHEFINPNIHVKTQTAHANDPNKQTPRPQPVKPKGQTSVEASQVEGSSFRPDSTFTPGSARTCKSGDERATPTNGGISATNEDTSTTDEGISTTNEGTSTTREDVLSPHAVSALPVPAVRRLRDPVYINVTPTSIKAAPSYENMQRSPLFPPKTRERDKPALTRSVPANPPLPTRKKPPVPIPLEVKSPGNTTPSLPNRAKSTPGHEAWTSLQDVPRDVDVSSLTVDAVVRCIQLLGFDDKAEAFRRENVDGRLLRALDENTLIRDFGFRAIEAKKVLLFASEGWQPKFA